MTYYELAVGDTDVQMLTKDQYDQLVLRGLVEIYEEHGNESEWHVKVI